MSNITVAISTFREGYLDWVIQLLDSLKNQTLMDFEVLLVVNSNQKYFINLQEMITTKDLPYKIKIVFNPVDKGIAHARNIALQNASTKYIAFTDDDAIPHPDWLKKLFETLKNNSNTGVVTGPVLPQWSQCVKDFGHSFPKELYWIIGCTSLDADAIIEVRNGFASNLALDRIMAIKSGGFNEATGYNRKYPVAGEEPELSVKLKKIGKLTLWNPGCIVFHRITSNRVRFQSLLARSFMEGRSKANLRRILGKDIMSPEVNQFLSVLQAIVKTKTFRSKALLITTTSVVLLSYSRYYAKR